MALHKKTNDKTALEIHHDSQVVDAHCDIAMALMPEVPRVGTILAEGKPLKTLAEHFRTLEAGGIKCQINNVSAVPIFHPVALKRAMQMLEVLISEIEKLNNKLEICRSYSDISRSLDRRKIAMILSVEGGEALMGDVRILRIFHRLGIRALGLTHLSRNILGDGSGEPLSDSKLSSFGVTVVEEMNKLGMIVDVSHMNDRGFWDVLERSIKPVIASHSNCRALCSYHRNLTDKQIKALGEKNGVLCISFLDKMVDQNSSKAGLARILDHVDHAVQVGGIDAVGIGVDYYAYKSINENDGLNDLSNLPKITKGLLAREYSKSEVSKILGGNMMRIFKQILTN